MEDGLFGRAFIEGLSGHADTNGDAVVTGTELGVFVRECVAMRSSGDATPAYTTIRVPGLDRGEIALSVRAE